MKKFKEYIKENPEVTVTPDGKELNYNDPEAITFIFIKNPTKGNLFVYDTNTTHAKLLKAKQELVQKHVGGNIMSYGRLWKNSKVITLWEKLKIEYLKELIKECIDNDLIKKEELSKWSIDTTKKGEPELKSLISIIGNIGNI